MKFIFILCALIAFVQSVSVYGKVNLVEPTSQRTKEITVSLENTNRMAYCDEEGNFVFNNVEPGFYLVYVNDNLYHYNPIFLEVTEKGSKAYEYSYINGKKEKHKNPFEISPLSPIKYKEDKPDLISSIIKSPYLFMIGIPLVLFLILKMIPQEDIKASQEEMRKQFKGFM